MPPKYDRIGKSYDQTRQADPYLSEQMYTLLGSAVHGQVVDIGCGSGNYTIALREKGISILGIDPSSEMLNKATAKAPNIPWLQGTAEDIPLEKDVADGVLASLTIHHWADLEQGMLEIARILKPDGRLVLFAFTRTQMRGYWLNHYFPIMIEESIQVTPKIDRVHTAMQQAGFGNIRSQPYFVQPDLKDQFLYVGKHRPECYFRPDIRQGISSFSAIANQDEVERGLIQLEEDIKTGEIQKIIAQYENDQGDYLFLTASL